MLKKPLPFLFPLNQEVIAQKRAYILGRLISSDEAFSRMPIQGISQQSLNLMRDLYDVLFLGGCLKKLNVRITLSSRMTSSAGKYIFIRSAFGRIRSPEIRMSSDYLLRLKQGPFELNGLKVDHAQEVFLLVFEHELCHAVEALLYGQTGHSSRFLSLANGLFGHTATRHKLPTRRQEAANDGLHVGMQVNFTYNGREQIGYITYIGKTATVMVSSQQGEYRDQKGRRYTKYRVPLNRLSKV